MTGRRDPNFRSRLKADGLLTRALESDLARLHGMDPDSPEYLQAVDEVLARHRDR